MRVSSASAWIVSLSVLAGASVVIAAPPPPPPALEYTSQMTSDPVNPSFLKSGLCTLFGGVCWDNQFADMADKAIKNKYNELAFCFNQCFGGGMIDELQDKGFTNVAYTSAARFDEMSIAIQHAAGQPAESTYNRNWSGAAGGAAPKTQKEAATIGRANDAVGPFSAKMWTRPQYTSDGANGDAIKLHKNSGVNPTANNKYLAIVFGGANAQSPPALPATALNDALTNGATTTRIINDMTAAGYVAAEVRTLLSNNPAGTQSTFKDLAKAWKDLGANSTATTQVFFWSSWGHGTKKLDEVAKKKFQAANAPKKGVAFNNSFGDSPESMNFFSQFQQVRDYYTSIGDPAGLPYFDITSDRPLVNPTVSINGIPLSAAGSDTQDIFDDGTDLDYDYRFSLPSSVMNTLSLGTTSYVIDYLSGGPASGDLDFMSAGITLGDLANGPNAPEPASIGCLMIIATLGFVRRRRQ